MESAGDDFKEDMLLLPEVKIEERDYSSGIKSEKNAEDSAAGSARARDRHQGPDSRENILTCVWLEKRLEVPF